MRCNDFPIALKKGTNDLAEIKEVENGKKCNCYCFYCEGDLIAVNRETNKVADHFKHTPESNCTLTYETYLHWVSKQILKELETIELPELRFKELYIKMWCVDKKKVELIDKMFSSHNVPEEFQDISQYNLIISPIKSVKIDSCELEKSFELEGKKIRADVSYYINQAELLVEPYFSHKISEEKLGLLKKMDKTTIEINLLQFQLDQRTSFTKDELRSYLFSSESKTWSCISSKSSDKLFQKFLKILDVKLLEAANIFTDFNSNKTQLTDNEFLINTLKNKISLLYDENQELSKRNRNMIYRIYKS